MTEQVPLGAELRREAARLRAQTPSEAFHQRLRANLARADVKQAAGNVRQRKNWLLHRWPYVAAALLPMTAVAAMTLMPIELGSQEASTTGYLERFDGIDVILVEGQKEHTWFDVDLWTHYHNGNEARVRVEVPHMISVMPASHTTSATPDCDGGQCIYQFGHPGTPSDRLPLQFGIRSPGHYRIRVVHTSAVARVHQEILVRARYDRPGNNSLAPPVNDSLD